MIAGVPSTCPTSLYSPARDTTIGATGKELRASLEDALMPPRPRNQEIIERLTAALRKGSLNEGVLVNVETVQRVFDLLAALPQDVAIPDIVVESGSEIGLDWQQDHRHVVTLTVDGSMTVGFAALFDDEPHYGRVSFKGVLPDTLAFLFDRLYPAHALAA